MLALFSFIVGAGFGAFLGYKYHPAIADWLDRSGDD